MVSQLRTVDAPPDTEVDRLLDQADEAPLLIVRNGIRYRVTRDVDDSLDSYDPERTRRALRKSAGALAGVDVEALKAELREQREQNSLGRPGW